MKSEPSEAGPILEGGATERYKAFGASPQTDAGNVVSAVCFPSGAPEQTRARSQTGSPPRDSRFGKEEGLSGYAVFAALMQTAETEWS